MQKSFLLNFISKYNTIDKIDQVVWEISGDQLKTKFISEDKSMRAELTAFGLKSEVDGVKLGVYTTSQFAKLLSPLSDEISAFGVEKVGDKLVSIKLCDENSKLKYALSDLAVIKFVPDMKYIPSKYELSFKIDDAFTNTFTKAFSALTDIITFSIETKNETQATLTLGQTDVNMNTFIMTLNTVKNEKIDKLSFNAKLLSEILMANKGVETNIEISNDGLAKLKFETKEYSAVYYLVAKK